MKLDKDYYVAGQILKEGTQVEVLDENILNQFSEFMRHIALLCQTANGLVSCYDRYNKELPKEVITNLEDFISVKKKMECEYLYK